MSTREITFELDGSEYTTTTPLSASDPWWPIYHDSDLIGTIQPEAKAFIPTDIEIIEQSVEEILYRTSWDLQFERAA